MCGATSAPGSQALLGRGRGTRDAQVVPSPALSFHVTSCPPQPELTHTPECWSQLWPRQRGAQRGWPGEPTAPAAAPGRWQTHGEGSANVGGKKTCPKSALTATGAGDNVQQHPPRVEMLWSTRTLQTCPATSCPQGHLSPPRPRSSIRRSEG